MVEESIYFLNAQIRSQKAAHVLECNWCFRSLRAIGNGSKSFDPLRIIKRPNIQYILRGRQYVFPRLLSIGPMLENEIGFKSLPLGNKQ